jgi:hypothetical protein
VGVLWLLLLTGAAMEDDYFFLLDELSMLTFEVIGD